MKSYYFETGRPIKMVATREEDTLNQQGTGWFYCDWEDFFKPELQNIDGVWKIVETATAVELTNIQTNKQLEQIDQLNQKFKADGEAYRQEIKNRVTASLSGKENVIPVIKEINNTVYVLLDKIGKGDWVLAMIDYMDNQNNPTIPEVLDLFNEVGQKAIEYYQTEYPH